MKRVSRPICSDGDHARIPLGNGLFALIDADDVSLVSGHVWCVERVGDRSYAKANYKHSDGRWGQIRLHRLITAAQDGFDVDHINRDGLDNRRSNLRIASRSENNMNARLRGDNKSGAKGVFWRADRGRWSAYINAYGQRKYLGHFLTKDAAEAARDSAAQMLHGKFRRSK
jgi:hypothetical protein